MSIFDATLSTYMKTSFRQSDEGDILDRAVGKAADWSWYGIKRAIQNPITRKIRSTTLMKKIGSGAARLATGAMKKLGETRVGQTVRDWTGKAATKGLELGVKTLLKTQIQSLAPEKPLEPMPEGFDAFAKPVHDLLADKLPLFSRFSSLLEKIFCSFSPNADSALLKNRTWHTRLKQEEDATKPSFLSQFTSHETSLVRTLTEKYLNTTNMQSIVGEVLTSCEEVMKAARQVACPFGKSSEQMKDDLTRALLHEYSFAETLSFSEYEKRVDSLIEQGLDRLIEKELPELNYVSRLILKHAVSALRSELLSLVKEYVAKNSDFLKGRKAADIQKHVLACTEVVFCRAMENLMEIWLGKKDAEPAKLDDAFKKVVHRIGASLDYAVDYHVDTEKVEKALLSEEQRDLSKEFEGLGTEMAHQAIDASTGLFSTIQPSHIFDEEVCDLMRKTIMSKQ